MTTEITKPETEALIERHLRSGRFHDIDDLLKEALGSRSTSKPQHRPRRKAQVGEPENLSEPVAPVRGLLTGDEIDTLFARNRSIRAESVDFS